MPLPSSKEGRKPIEQNVKWEDVLTKKESNDLKPRIVDALGVVFKSMDKGIGGFTKDVSQKEVFIWSSISKEELEVIASAIVENGQRSKVIATMTRRIARDYQKFQLGIILLPRLYMTVSHFMQNGLANPFGKKQLG